MVIIALTKKQAETWSQTLELIAILDINPAPDDKRVLDIIKAKLDDAHLKEDWPSELHRVRGLLGGMVRQHCSEHPGPDPIMTMALSANEEAINYLERIGWLELMKIKLLRWKWTEKAFDAEKTQ